MLLSEFCVYVYRDVAPLATKHYGMDRDDGWLAVLRLVLLFIGGIWTPITLPRTYKPVDPSVSTGQFPMVSTEAHQAIETRDTGY
jgi:hypothetical protein